MGGQATLCVKPRAPQGQAERGGATGLWEDGLQMGGRQVRPLPTFSWGHCTCHFDTCVSPGALRGPPRRPPPHILDQVKGLNQSLRLGHLLCRSRNPDFLLNIIQRQVGTPEAAGGSGIR